MSHRNQRVGTTFVVLVFCFLGTTIGDTKDKQPSPCKEPQKRSKRIRANPGSWNPIIDLTEIFPGNLSVDKNGRFRLYDGASGVQLRVELADRSPALLEAAADWEIGGSIGPLFIWKADGRFLWH